jgi:hypothetical protein
MSNCVLRLALCLVCVLAYAGIARTQEHHHGDDEELHFSHPLIAESPAPDTKVRFDYFDRRFGRNADNAVEHNPRVEFEYAFRRDFSIEIDAPYTFRRSEITGSVNHADTLSVAVKLANFVFEKQHVLLDYGVEFGLPTGSDQKEIGSGHLVEIEPYFGAGLKKKKFELVGFSSVGFLAHKNAADEEGNEFNYRFSMLLKPRPGLQPLIEMDGTTVLSGPEHGSTIVNISPGIKFAPPESEHWQFGIGAGFPVTHTKDFNTRLVVSVFYHFH